MFVRNLTGGLKIGTCKLVFSAFFRCFIWKYNYVDLIRRVVWEFVKDLHRHFIFNYNFRIMAPESPDHSRQMALLWTAATVTGLSGHNVLNPVEVRIWEASLPLFSFRAFKNTRVPWKHNSFNIVCTLYMFDCYIIYSVLPPNDFYLQNTGKKQDSQMLWNGITINRLEAYLFKMLSHSNVPAL